MSESDILFSIPAAERTFSGTEKEDRKAGAETAFSAPEPGLAAALLRWYDSHKRSLPWREDPSPYHVWISEIMLQQTRVEAVKGYYARFLDRFPDIRALAEADEDVCLKLWEGLGYYSRARNLQKAARQILSDYGGVMPSRAAELRRLPGIGPYTSAAIASIAFGERIPAVDGNLLRVFARLSLYEKEIKTPAAAAEASAYFLQCMPEDRPGDFNQALMDLGAGICTPGSSPACGGESDSSPVCGGGPDSSPACGGGSVSAHGRGGQGPEETGPGPEAGAKKAVPGGDAQEAGAKKAVPGGDVQEAGAKKAVPGGHVTESVEDFSCPLQAFCGAFRTGCADRLPVMPAKKARRIDRRTILVIRDDDRVLLRRRPARGLLAGLYEFPNEEGWLTPKEAVERARAYGCDPVQIRPLPDAVHVFTHREWHMHGYEIRSGGFPESGGRTGTADSRTDREAGRLTDSDADSRADGWKDGRADSAADSRADSSAVRRAGGWKDSRADTPADSPADRGTGRCFAVTVRDLKEKYPLPSAYEAFCAIL